MSNSHPSKDSASSVAQDRQPKRIVGRVVKTGVGIGLLAAVGWYPALSLTQTTSAEAVVNARMVTVRSPIAGIVTNLPPTLRSDAKIGRIPGTVIIVNDRADAGRLNAVSRELEQFARERQAVEDQVETLVLLRSRLQARQVSFIAGRKKQLAGRIAVREAELEAARAEADNASTSGARMAALGASGVVSSSTLADTDRRVLQAKALHEAALARLSSDRIEFDALDMGDFSGESSTDMPQAAQRIHEIDVSLAALRSENAKISARLAGAKRAHDQEVKAHELASEARLEVPDDARVWETLSARGEHVVAGQELVRLLDCTETLVTAVVDERTFNGLSRGRSAVYYPPNNREGFIGRVVHLGGLSTANGNFAIPPSSLTKGTHHVTVAVKDGGNETCMVGQNGRLVFGSL